jgi:hypothetical protein
MARDGRRRQAGRGRRPAGAGWVRRLAGAGWVRRLAGAARRRSWPTCGLRGVVARRARAAKRAAAAGPDDLSSRAAGQSPRDHRDASRAGGAAGGRISASVARECDGYRVVVGYFIHFGNAVSRRADGRRAAILGSIAVRPASRGRAERRRIRIRPAGYPSWSRGWPWASRRRGGAVNEVRAEKHRRRPAGRPSRDGDVVTSVERFSFDRSRGVRRGATSTRPRCPMAPSARIGLRRSRLDRRTVPFSRLVTRRPAARGGRRLGRGCPGASSARAFPSGAPDRRGPRRRTSGGCRPAIRPCGARSTGRLGAAGGGGWEVTTVT